MEYVVIWINPLPLPIANCTPQPFQFMRVFIKLVCTQLLPINFHCGGCAKDLEKAHQFIHTINEESSAYCEIFYCFFPPDKVIPLSFPSTIALLMMCVSASLTISKR